MQHAWPKSVLLCVLNIAALAQAASDVATSLHVSLIVTQPDGTESRQAAEAARPGDVLEYVAEFHNSTDHVIRQLAATLPIPPGTEYIPSSAQPAGVQASLDGASFAPVPLTRKVVQADGRLIDQLIPYSNYRFLRWPSQDLGAHGTVRVTARARLSTGVPPAHH